MCVGAAFGATRPRVADAAALRAGGAQDGYTPLLWALCNGHYDVVRLLLERGANKNATNNVRAPVARAANAVRCVQSARVVVSATAACLLFTVVWPL